MNARWLLVPLMLLGWHAVAGAQQQAPLVRLRAIALTGQTAPGVGTPFADFTTPFGYADTVVPTLDASGNACIFAHVVDPLDPQARLSGLWKEVGGELRLLALQGQPAPGTGESFAAFPSPFFETPPLVAAGMASFLASTASSSVGLWTDRGGALGLIVRAGDPLPAGGPAGQQFISPVGEIHADGSVLVSSRWSASYGDEGFWRDRTGVLELLVRAGSPAPGMPGAVFGTSNSLHLQGPFDHTDTDSHGRLAFNGTVQGAGIGITNDEGIWVETRAGLRLVVAEGDPAPVHPGFRFGVQSGPYAFGQSQHTRIRRNERGSVLFGAFVHGNGYDHVRSLWRARAGGPPELIATAREPWSGWPGTPQPGTGSAFFTFLQHASINASDRIAFQDVVPHPLNGMYNLETGIFWGHPGQLELLIATETWIPGLHPGELINTLQLGELLDDGSLYATATLKDGPNGPERALLLFQPDGSPSVLIREGATVDVAGDGSDPRTVAELGIDIFGSRFSATARFGLRLAFTDGSSGMFHLDVLRPFAPQPR